MRPDVLLAQATPQTEEAHLGTLNTQEAHVPSCPSVTARISCRGKRIGRASGGLNCFLTCVCCGVRAGLGEVNRGVVAGVCWVLEAALSLPLG